MSALLQIIGINIVLSGDNARRLKGNQQKQAVFWRSAAAIILRMVLTIFAVQLLQLP